MAVDSDLLTPPPQHQRKDLKIVLTESVEARRPTDALEVRVIAKPQQMTTSVAVADLSAMATLRFTNPSWLKWGKKLNPGLLYRVEGFEVGGRGEKDYYFPPFTGG